MMIKRLYLLVSAILLFPYISSGQQSPQLRNPFDFPALLSGGFGELRSNHFHSGIDFKTQGVEGKPVHAVQDGFVSRIGVSPFGYGHVLYLDHPDGTTTVYGHLQQFNKEISAFVREKQYEQETFAIQLYPGPEQFAVAQGDVIALSGNTGSSGGPHLHFEIRDTQTEEVIDPLVYYKDRVKDSRPPQIQGVMIYPLEGRGAVDHQSGKKEYKPRPAGRIEAWGGIGFAVKAYDYMDATSNIYGVKKIILEVDGVEVFRSYIDRFALDETRYLNSFTDYAEWRDQRSFYMKSFVEPGNKLSFIESKNRGIVSVNEERPYDIRYYLEDEHGNGTALNFTVYGKEQDIHAPETMDASWFHWKSDNRFGAKGIRLFVPKNNLYDDLYFRYDLKEDSTALSGTHVLHTYSVPFHDSAELSLRLQTDTLENKKQYGIVRIQNGRASWMGGEYRNGWIDVNIRELGSYAIRQDNKPPVITPLKREIWSSSRKIEFRIVDDLSGVKTYRGEIDGQFVLFEYDGKTGRVCYSYKAGEWVPGKYPLQLTVTDSCGNYSVYTDTLTLQ